MRWREGTAVAARGGGCREGVGMVGRREGGGAAHGGDGDGKEEAAAAGERHGCVRANEGDIGLPGPTRTVWFLWTAHRLVVRNGWLRCASSLVLPLRSDVSRAPSLR